MVTTVNRWGNSLGVRLPKALLAQADIWENSRVEVSASEGRLVISPVRAPGRHVTLAERLKGWDGERIEGGEMDWGPPVGEEAW